MTFRPSKTWGSSKTVFPFENSFGSAFHYDLGHQEQENKAHDGRRVFKEFVSRDGTDHTPQTVMTTRAPAVLIMMNNDYFDYFVDDCEHYLITMMIMTMLKGVYMMMMTMMMTRTLMTLMMIWLRELSPQYCTLCHKSLSSANPHQHKTLYQEEKGRKYTDILYHHQFAGSRIIETGDFSRQVSANETSDWQGIDFKNKTRRLK